MYSHKLRSPLARTRMSLQLMASKLIASRASGVALRLSPEEEAELAWGGPALRSPDPSQASQQKAENLRSIAEPDHLIYKL